eukprot:6212622-Pleurochrysis_carterae.AAC.2
MSYSTVPKASDDAHEAPRSQHGDLVVVHRAARKMIASSVFFGFAMKPLAALESHETSIGSSTSSTIRWNAFDTRIHTVPSSPKKMRNRSSVGSDNSVVVVTSAVGSRVLLLRLPSAPFAPRPAGASPGTHSCSSPAAASPLLALVVLTD